MDSVDLKNVFNIYAVTDKKNHPRLLGRVVVTPTEISVLADYDDSLQSLNGSATPQRLRRFAQWCDSSYSFGVSLQDLKDGLYPNLLPEAKIPSFDDSKPAPEKWFKVQRDDLPSPMLLRFNEGKAYVADSDAPLEPKELDRLLDLAKQGKASIKHHKPVEQMVDMLKSLSKSEPEAAPQDPMSNLLFKDPLSPELMNRHDFYTSPEAGKVGVWVMLKTNDIHSINKVHGDKEQEAGLKQAGNCLAATLKGKPGWHLQAGQFAANLTSSAEAATFLRELRNNLEKIVPIGGTHKLSMNAGLGDSPVAAQKALDKADEAKDAGNHLAGNAPGYVYSLLKGSEGPVAPEQNIPVQP